MGDTDKLHTSRNDDSEENSFYGKVTFPGGIPQDSLVNSAEFLNKIFEKTPSPMWISDSNGTVIRINQALRDNLEVTDENVVGKYNVLHDVQVKEQGFLGLVNSTYEDGKHVEFTIVYDTAKELQLGVNEGVSRIIEITLTPVISDSGKVSNVICMQRDITEQELLRKSLLDTNRALLVLSESNQVLVHATDERELLETVCRILIEKGGYMFAWVGYAENDAEKSIVPISHKGIDNGYLARVKATWSESEHGQGPTGTAIRTGDVSVIDDIRNDPHFQPWRERAEENHFLSAVALPLKDGDLSFGAITIYSDKVQAFSDDEIFLLTEMAEDLSYGILVLRGRSEHEKAERIIEENEQRLRDAQALGKIGNWEYDIQSGEMLWYEGMYEIYGRDPSLDPPGVDENYKYYSPEQLEKFERYTRQLLAEKEEISYDMEIFTENGESRILSGMIRPVLDEHDEVVRVFGIVRDITEQKQTEEELQLRAKLLDSASDGICLLTLDERKFVYVNEGCCSIHGYTREELLGSSIHQFEVLSTAEDTCRITNDIRTNGSIVIEGTYLRKDGSEVPVENHIVIIPVGDKEYFLSVERDLTEKKQAEKTLQESEEKFRTISDQSLMGVAILQDNVIKYINDSMAGMYGYTTEEVYQLEPGQFFNAFSPEMIEFIKEQATKKQSGDPDQVSSYRIKATHKNGGTIWAENYSRTIMYEGRPADLITQIDVTEQQKMQAQLIMSDRLASIGALVSGIAHEINNPMTGIIGFSDILLAGELPGNLREDVEVINNEALRISGIVQDLLSFSREHKDEKQSVDIRDVITATLKLRSYEHELQNIKVHVRLPSDLPVIRANKSQLQQVFLNTIINAEQAMLEAHNKGTLTISGEKKGNIVRIAVADDGPGIPGDIIGKLFDPFFTTKEEGKGTGLGLSISYGIVTDHGGTIQAVNNQEGGATFIIELPIEEAS